MSSTIVNPLHDSAAAAAGEPSRQAGQGLGVLQWCQVVSVCYAALVLLPSGSGMGSTQWGDDGAENGNSTASEEYPRLCPRAIICSEGWFQLALIGGARLSAYAMFPLLAVAYLTKCHALTTVLERTIVSVWLPLHDLHQVHASAGRAIGWLTLVHALCHGCRWAARRELGLLLSAPAGASGLVAALCAAPICLLMGGPARLRASLSWEVRKAAHLLCAPFGIALLWHTPRMLVFCTAVMGVYGADQAFTVFAASHRIDKPAFTRLANAVILTFANPAEWKDNGIGYINVLVPWISRFQHHPFSVYAHPKRKNHSCVCIVAGGDWTRRLHDSLATPTTRPVWISGPFISPYQGASEHDNLMLVATGVGITPALSCLEHHRNHRKVSLLWMCRDPSLVEFFLDVFTFDDEGFTLIFYTGKTSLQLPKNISPHVYILPGRPNIQQVIGSVVQSVDEDVPLSSDLLQQSMAFMVKHLAEIGELELAATALERVATRLRQLLQSGVSLQTIMAAFDTDASSSIDLNELNTGLVSLNIRLSQTELDELMHAIDTNGTGAISSREWIDFIESRVQLPSTETESVRMQAVSQWRSMTTEGRARMRLLKKLVRQGARVLYEEMNRGEVDQLSETDIKHGVARLTTVLHIDLQQPSLDIVAAILTNGCATIAYDEFAEGFSMLQGLTVFLERSITSSTLASSVQSSAAKVKIRHPDRWMLLYCGGSAPVMDALSEFSREFGIKYTTESFRW
eukprot:SAG11_NODE_2022_length_3911_cov_2.647954_2_plen_742_part_00